MYLPCMGSDLDDDGLETLRHIGHWVDQVGPCGTASDSDGQS